MHLTVQTIFVVFLSLIVLFMVIVLAVMARYVNIWFQAFMSGVPISIFEIIGMRFRRTNVSAVVRALVMAKQGGVAVSCDEMEMVYLQGVNLEKVTLAAIEAKKQGIDITFDELVDAERQDRLAEKLKM
jgi:uncharacterized protein YqfA (UPF0365 family)